MPSHITNSTSTFLTNLRLLDFDYREDWPDVKADLFCAKDARVNQKQRIRCVEWALYTLFELWNPKETKNKLQPFFPSYDALRSTNLRAALFRCLNDLKKDGVLEKDLIIRKTMFDECRGEKFEKLLTSFSTLVLQKVSRGQGCTKTSIGGQLATAQLIPVRGQPSLLPLAIAHQGALRDVLGKKDQLANRYTNFGSFLKAKEQVLLEKVHHLAREDLDCPLDAVPDRTVQEIRQHFDGNWQGDTRWISGMVESDMRDVSDSLLDSPFPAVWSHVEKGSIGGFETIGQESLLQDLNSRISTQRMRLRHWQNIHRDMVKSRPRSPVKSKENTTPYRNRRLQSPLKFGYINQDGTDDHLNSAGISPEVKMQYRRLLERRQGHPKAMGSVEVQTPSKGSMNFNQFDSPNLAQTELIALPSGPDPKVPTTPQRNVTSATLDKDPPEGSHGNEGDGSLPLIGPTFARQKHQLFESSPRAKDIPAVFGSQTSQEDRIGLGDNHENLRTPVTKKGFHSLNGLTTVSPPVEDGFNREDALAQQIILSAMNADPSPVKTKISLMERTRQSIAFARPESLLPDSLDGSTLIQSSRKTDSQSSQCDTLQRSTSLLERTRRSISLLPAPKGPRKSIHGRRESRQYPRNQFETPRKQLEDLKEMTPPEILFTPEADYASVFKSRPKIATSPKLSPTLARDF